MPTTYSTNLALSLMANGEDNGTWGTNTNTNLGTLIEQAIVGQGSVVMADATTTITMAQGATSATRCYVLNLTGALTATRDLVVPTINKNYVIANNTTGSQSVRVKTSAGTGITVANGDRMALYVDGTNVVNLINNISQTSFGAITVTSINGLTVTTSTGTLTVANGKTLTASNTLTLTGTDSTSFAFPSTSDTVVTLTATQTLTNKTLTSPALTTPTLGVATATSINKVAFTAPATSATLTLIDGTTVTGPAVSGTMATLAGTETLTNKTLTTAALGSSTATTQSAGDNSTKVATTAYVDTVTPTLAKYTNSLSGDVAINNSAFTTGPQVAQGSSGTWYASGTVCVTTTEGGSGVFQVTLSDGSTVIASAVQQNANTLVPMSMSLSGYIASPAGNLRISAKSITYATGSLVANYTGQTKDSTISAIRIA